VSPVSPGRHWGKNLLSALRKSKNIRDLEGNVYRIPNGGWPNCFVCCTKILFENYQEFMDKCNCPACLQSQFCSAMPAGTPLSDSRLLTCDSRTPCVSEKFCTDHGATRTGNCVDEFQEDDSVTCTCNFDKDPGETYIYMPKLTTEEMEKPQVKKVAPNGTPTNEFVSVVELVHAHYNYVNKAAVDTLCTNGKCNAKFQWVRLTDVVRNGWVTNFRTLDQPETFHCATQRLPVPSIKGLQAIDV